MSGESRDQWARRVMGGEDRSLAGRALRLATAIAEPGYAGVVRARNAMYDRGLLQAARAGRPVISVGNLTTGGTGKTPVVRWLATRLREQGRRPTVLLRGYTVGNSVDSDERELLSFYLNDGRGERVPVEADASRVEGARRVVRERPETGVIVLDDGFQHRKLARDFDLVLINAADPFGFGRVLPRGMLREPLSGLRRAHAVLVTRADQVPDDRLTEIERVIRRYSTSIPIYRAAHAHLGLRSATCPTSEPPDTPLEELGRRRFFAFAGIGNPQSLEQQLRRQPPAAFAGRLWFPDHHDYAQADLDRVRSLARAAGAEVLLTTEKDWMKVSRLPGAGRSDPPIYRVEVEVRFFDTDEDRLLSQILGVIDGGGRDGTG